MRSGVVAHGGVVRTGVSGGVRVPSRPGTTTRVRMSGGVIHIVRRSASPVRRVPFRDQNFFNQDFFDDDDFPVPGLGFDFVHFAATHPNAFRGRHRFNLGGFFPFFSGGFVMPSVPAVIDEEPADSENTVAVDDTPRRRVRVVAAAPEPAAAPVLSPAAESASTVPNEEYVFVRRDGTLFFAVAYSWENGALRYITSQGLRGTLTREALDLNATQQFNDQRGLIFHAPA